MTDSPPDKKPHYAGHRKRLRERFMADAGQSMADYELLEMVLFQAFPRQDVKPLAKALIDKFGDFGAVISAEPARLEEIDGIGEAAVATLKVIEAAAVRLARSKVLGRPVLGSWQALLDYCQASMGHNKTEQFRVLFLDRKNVLIGDEIQQRGTVDHTPVYPREVVKRALELGASALILVHNHPSGDPTPSRADIEMTRQIAEAGKSLGIALHDHLVIGKAEHASFKSLGLL
jgi:DNA repair protein RadC